MSFEIAKEIQLSAQLNQKYKGRKKTSKNIMRQPGIEPGPHRWQRRILTTELLTLVLILLTYARPGSNRGPTACEAVVITN